ncbi:DUF6035 family protein [Flectobacillus rivi]|uniref:DUF6035 family protein n=1 Tax=Flectobacillus rivi TaxID=2984209 RepID=A0ABT6Z1C9_9BACT|nr:DUF6035 family protein [Flectobacillus rivi]MDI9874941.1 DUF6035 family protein [Flectobacillus rivi]
MSDQETKRTIDEVLDVETGEIIKAEIFFQKTESEIIAYRRRLQEAIVGFEPPKFRCAYCNQLLKLSGKPTRRGKVSFFAHLYDSDDCEIKTNGDLSKEEIEALKYGNVGESERHKVLKNKLAYYLRSTPAISNVEVEKKLTSEVPYLFWRRPDVYAEYDGKSIVFELQLSTTFLSVIIDRDIFYRMNNTFIVWVFNFSDNKEYLDLQNLMAKDIYYANKRNAFVFDEKAQAMSEETGELHLLCIWFEPSVLNGEIQQNKSIRKEEYIKISDLKFDSNAYKPYYIDADALFAEYQSDYFESKIDFENLHKVRLEKIAKKNRERERDKALKDQIIIGKKEQIIQGAFKLTPFQKGKKWGYEADGIEIVEPKYTDITDFSDSDYAKVKFNRKYGFINRVGDFTFDPIFMEAFNIYQNKCIGKFEKDWCIIDLENKSSSRLNCYDVEKLSENFLRITHRVTKKVFSGVNYGGYRTYSNEHIDTISTYSMVGNIITKCLYHKVYDYRNGRLTSKIKEYYLCEDINGERISITEEEKQFIKIIQIGIVDSDDNIIVPFDFDTIDEFIEGKAKAKKSGKYGYIDDQGQIIIPFEYDLIEEFIEGKAKAKKSGKYGYIDDQGQIIISFEYDSIEEFIEGIAKAKKTGKYGYIDDQGQIIISFEYDSIEEFIEGKAKVKKSGKYGYIDHRGQIIILIKYDSIDDFIDGSAKVRRNFHEGYIDINGNELIQNVQFITDTIRKGEKFGKWGLESLEGFLISPFEYDHIEDFINSKAKAKTNGKYGYLDDYGQIIIPFEYDSIENFISGRAKARLNGKYGYIDEQGQTIIPFEYDSIENFINGRAKARLNGKDGYIDEEGIIIIPFEYGSIEDFIDGRAKARLNGKYGYIDEQGVTVIPFEYDLLENFIEGRVKARLNGKYGFIDEQGITIIPCVYDLMEDFIEGRAKVTVNGKYGYIDKQGIQIIPCEYDLIEDFIEGRSKVKKNGKYGYIDETGIIVIPSEYDLIENFIDGIARAKKNNLFGFINEQGQTLIQFEFDVLWYFDDGKAKAIKNKKYGYIDDKGQTLIPFEYDSIEHFSKAKLKAVKNDEISIIDYSGNGIVIFEKTKVFVGKYGETITNHWYGIKDTKGNILLPPKYNEIDEFEDGLAKIYGDKQYIGGDKSYPRFSYKVGYVDDNGKIAAPCIFDEISRFVDGKATAKKNGESLIINIYEGDPARENIDRSQYKVKSIHKGKITNVAEFGLFVKLGKGITALLHISELKKHQKSITDYTRGEEIEVQIMDIDEKRNRISLTIPKKENK